LPRAIADFKSRSKIELEAAGLPQAEVVAKVSDILTETTEKIALVIGEAGQNPE
jgi:hypothetical protein